MPLRFHRSRRRARRRRRTWLRRVALALAALPLTYLLAALVGSLIPVNRDWTEPENGVTVYIANNGIHSDIVMPARAEGLDWGPLVPKSDFAGPDAQAQWVAFGSGEARVYLETPRWRDIKPSTIWSALTGGISPPVGRDPFGLRRWFRRQGDAHRSPWIRPVRRLLLGDGQGQRDPYVQQLGRGPAAHGRRQDQPLAAIRPGVCVAL
jgi:hypothetical protein